MLERLLAAINWQAERRENLDDQLMRLLLLARSRNLDTPDLLRRISERDPAAAAILVRRFAAHNDSPQAGEYWQLAEEGLARQVKEFNWQGLAAAARKEKALPREDAKQSWLLLAAAVGLERMDLLERLMDRCPKSFHVNMLARAITEINRLPHRLEALAFLLDGTEDFFSDWELSNTLENAAYLYEAPPVLPQRLISLTRKLMEKKRLPVLSVLTKVIKGLNIFKVPGVTPQSICGAAADINTAEGYFFSHFMLAYMYPGGPRQRLGLDPLEHWRALVSREGQEQPWADFIYLSILLRHKKQPEMVKEALTGFPWPWGESSYHCEPRARLVAAKLIAGTVNALLFNSHTSAPAYLRMIKGFNVFAAGGGVSRPYSYLPKLPPLPEGVASRLYSKDFSSETSIWLYMNSHLRCVLGGSAFLSRMLVRKHHHLDAEDLIKEFATYPLYADISYREDAQEYRVLFRNIAPPTRAGLDPLWQEAHDEELKALTYRSVVVCRLKGYVQKKTKWLIGDITTHAKDEGHVAPPLISLLDQVQSNGRFTPEIRESLSALPAIRGQDADQGWHLSLSILRALAAVVEKDPADAMDLLKALNQTELNNWRYREDNASDLFPNAISMQTQVREELQQVWNRFTPRLLSRVQLIELYFNTALRALPFSWLLSKCYPPQLREDGWANLALIPKTILELALYCTVEANEEGGLYTRPRALGRGGCEYHFDKKFIANAALKKGDLCVCRPVYYDFHNEICYLDGYKTTCAAPPKKDKAALVQKQ